MTANMMEFATSVLTDASDVVYVYTNTSSCLCRHRVLACTAQNTRVHLQVYGHKKSVFKAP